LFLHHFTEVYDIFAPFLPLLKQKTLVGASVFLKVVGIRLSTYIIPYFMSEKTKKDRSDFERS
jgi:hypothetical protein